MFELIEVKIDTDKVAKYRKYDSTSPTFLDYKAYTIILSQHLEAYFKELSVLLNRYKVSEIHRDNFLYIIGQHFFIYEVINEKKADAIECFEPLKFLHAYQFQNQQLAKTFKSESSLKSRLSSRYLEVKLPHYKDDNTITLGNTDFVVKAIYQLFKKQYQFSLKEMLADYEDIPSLAILTDLLNEVNYIINHADHYLVAEIAEDLLDYMNNHMIGELSRKQYLFIFDLMLISGVFLIVIDADTKQFMEDDEFTLHQLEPTIKVAYLKKLVKNYRKSTKNHP